MNAEQRKQTLELIESLKITDADLSSAEVAALLQELIDAPETEPVAKTTGYYGGHLTISTVDGRVLPFGTALYLAPPAPSVSDGWKHDCAGILQNDVELWVDSCPHCGKPRPAAPTPAEAPEDVVRDAERWRMLPAFLEEFEISYLRLEDAIDAAIEREKMKGGEA